MRPHRKKSELDPAKWEAMKSALNVQRTFLDMTSSTTGGHLPHGVIKLRRAETITSASPLEVELEADSIEQFPEITISSSSKPVRQAADRSPRQ
jgi:hypothetical protein